MRIANDFNMCSPHVEQSTVVLCGSTSTTFTDLVAEGSPVVFRPGRNSPRYLISTQVVNNVGIASGIASPT